MLEKYLTDLAEERPIGYWFLEIIMSGVVLFWFSICYALADFGLCLLNFAVWSFTLILCVVLRMVFRIGKKSEQVKEDSPLLFRVLRILDKLMTFLGFTFFIFLVYLVLSVFFPAINIVPGYRPILIYINSSALLICYLGMGFVKHELRRENT